MAKFYSQQSEAQSQDLQYAGSVRVFHKIESGKIKEAKLTIGNEIPEKISDKITLGNSLIGQDQPLLVTWDLITAPHAVVNNMDPAQDFVPQDSSKTFNEEKWRKIASTGKITAVVVYLHSYEKSNPSPSLYFDFSYRIRPKLYCASLPPAWEDFLTVLETNPVPVGHVKTVLCKQDVGIMREMRSEITCSVEGGSAVFVGTPCKETGDR